MPESGDQNPISLEGFIAFNRMEHALRAEKFLKAAGLAPRVAVPPQMLDSACNLGLMFDFSKRKEVERILQQKKAEYTCIRRLDTCA